MIKMKLSSLLSIIASILFIISGVIIIVAAITELKFLLYIMAACLVASGTLFVVAIILKKSK